jgi:hypothetical protein
MTGRDLLIVFLGGPALSVFLLWGAVSGSPVVGAAGLALAASPAFIGLIWGISQRPTVAFGIVLTIAVGAVTVGLAYASIAAWFIWKSQTDPGFLN